MGGWLSLGGITAEVKDTNKTTNTQTNQSGTQSPVLSDYWKNAFGNASNNIGTYGYNPAQQSAMDFAKNQMSVDGYAHNPDGSIKKDATGKPIVVNPAIAGLNKANTDLGGLNSQLVTNNDYWKSRSLMPNATSAGTTAQGVNATTSTAAAPGTITARTAASAVEPYSALYGKELIDPSLAAMDYGTNRAFSALDARTAGAGGFANSRSGLGYSDLGTQTALQRGQFAAQLKNLGLTNALGFATGDVERAQGADTQNVDNVMGIGKFNAGQTQDVSKFNAGQGQTNNQFNATQGQQNNQFNVNTGITQQAGRDAAITAAQANIAQQAGLTQQQAANLVTANGINVEAANAMFGAGQISQQQLTQLLQLAQTANGQNFEGNTGSSTHSNEIMGDVTAKFGINP